VFLIKSHVTAHSRTSKTGKVSMVREHEDRRKPSEEARHFQEETHQQKGGGMRLGKLSLDEIVTIVKKGLETVGMKAAAGDVNKGNVKRYMEWVIHEFSKQGVTYDVRTREAHVNEKLKAKANHIIGLFQQAQKQLHAMG